MSLEDKELQILKNRNRGHAELRLKSDSRLTRDIMLCEHGAALRKEKHDSTSWWSNLSYELSDFTGQLDAYIKSKGGRI